MTEEQHLRRIYRGIIKTASKTDKPKTEDEFVKSALIRQNKESLRAKTTKHITIL